MDLKSKSEVQELLGPSKWGNLHRLIGKLDYQSGIAAFDRVEIGPAYSKLNGLVHLHAHPDGLQVTLAVGFKSYRVALPAHQIISVTLEGREHIVEMKEKSVIGRALLGGLLLGPVGAIVGGMTGVGQKEVPSSTPDIFITINHVYEGKAGVIILTGNHKDRTEIEQFFKSNTPNFSIEEAAAAHQPSYDLSAIDKLEKLGRLKADGVISEDEFRSMKAKVLNED